MSAPIVPLTSRIPVKSRIISVSSAGNFQNNKDYSQRFLAKNINEGKAYFFKTKADGTYDIEIIITDNEKIIETLELDDELIDRSTPAIIKLSQNAEVGDVDYLGSEYSFKFKINPGNYLVRIFFTGNDVEFYGFKIVLLPITQEAKNNFLLIDSLK